MIYPDIKIRLEEPFPVNKLHWRIGATNREKTSGIALAYLDARDVMHRLDQAVGWDGWQTRYTHADKLIICEVGLHLNADRHAKHDNGWVWRANGAGETAVEGEKGGASDAFKRAAVMWGIGRYLYSIPTIWVPVQQRGNSVAFADQAIQQAIQRLPQWATPEGYRKLVLGEKTS